MEGRPACTALTVGIPDWKVGVLAARWGCALQTTSPSKATVVARRARPKAVLVGGGTWGPELATLAWRLATERLAPTLLLIGPSWRRPPQDSTVEETENVLWGVVPETAERQQWESALRTAVAQFARAQRPAQRRSARRAGSVEAPVAPKVLIPARTLVPPGGAFSGRLPLAELPEGLLRQGALASAHRPRALAPGGMVDQTAPC